MSKKFSDLTYSEFIALEKHAVFPDPIRIMGFVLPWGTGPDTPTCRNLLDFGAGNYKETYYKDLCENYFPVERDTAIETPYRKLSDLPDDMRLDGIIANQVFEHMEPDEISEILCEMYEKMNSDGMIVITIPNLKKWSSYIRDLDHKNRLLPVHVCCLLSLAGFVPMYSFYYTKHPDNVNRLIGFSDTTKEVSSLMYDLYGIHPADFVAIVGQKKLGGVQT